MPGPAGATGRLNATGEPRLSRVTAQPTEDPTDPLVILRDLPEREREEFLLQYHRAVSWLDPGGPRPSGAGPPGRAPV
jgi:hypothetical protein